MSGLLNGDQLQRVSNAWRRALRSDPVLSRQNFPNLPAFAEAFNGFLTGEDDGSLPKACDEFVEQGLQPALVIQSVTILAETMIDEYGMTTSGAVTRGFVSSLGYVCGRLTTTMVANEAVLARRDHLTGLEIRLALEEHLAGLIDTGVAVAFIDLDGLKEINDRDGHEAGDAYIQKFAADLRSSLPDGATAYRLNVGGDEFVAVLPQASPALLKAILEKLRATEGVAPFSFGIAVSPDDGTSVDELLEVADRAMYLMKQASKAAKGANVVATGSPLGSAAESPGAPSGKSMMALEAGPPVESEPESSGTETGAESDQSNS